MTMQKNRWLFGSLWASVAYWPAVGLGAPLSTAITYQSQLKDNGVPVSGSCDFQFSLWTAQGGGSQIGGTVSALSVTVVNGLFEAQIDFGAASFPGDARWLQVAVHCPTGVGGFTTLAPREPLTAAPYALQTRGVFVNDAQKVGIGTLLPSHALTIGSADQATLRLIGPLGGYGWGARLNFGDGDLAFMEEDSDDNLNFRANRFAFTDGQVGIGTATPAARLDVLSSGETAVRGATNWVGVHGIHQADGSFPGVWGEADSTSARGSGVRGFATATTGGSYGVYGKSSSAGGVGVHAENTANGTAISALGDGSALTYNAGNFVWSTPGRARPWPSNGRRRSTMTQAGRRSRRAIRVWLSPDAERKHGSPYRSSVVFIARNQQLSYAGTGR